MEHRKSGSRVVVRLDRGDEVISSLSSICREEGIGSATVDGIGALSKAEIAHFDSKGMRYRTRSIEGMYEILSLKGNVATLDDGPVPHLHIVVAGPDMLALGGHLNMAEVDPTCEIVINVLETGLRREKDERTGLNLLRL